MKKKIFNLLKEIIKEHPQLRVGQILENFAGFISVEKNKDLFYVENADFYKYLLEFKEWLGKN